MVCSGYALKRLCFEAATLPQRLCSEAAMTHSGYALSGYAPLAAMLSEAIFHSGYDLKAASATQPLYIAAMIYSGYALWRLCLYIRHVMFSRGYVPYSAAAMTSNGSS